jgi:hypothetical protein
MSTQDTPVRILPFPFADDLTVNEPITEERIALVNAIGDRLRTWITEHPRTTRPDVEWALAVVSDCLVTEGGA